MKLNPFHSILSLIIFYSFNASAQHSKLNEFDQQKFDESIEWLEDAMDFSYFNPETNLFWTNRFFYNKRDNTFSLRSISTYEPNSAIKKKVIDRTVKIEDLDVKSISLNLIEENRGRIVLGTSIEIHVLGHERKIQRSFDGRLSVKESMLEIPIPQYFEDSVQHFSTMVKERLETVIDLATKIYPSDVPQENLALLLEVMSGTFQGSNGTSRFYQGVFDAGLDCDVTKGELLVGKELLGFNTTDQKFFLWMISADSKQQIELELDVTKNLSLYSKEKNYKFTVFGTHHFSIEENGVLLEYYKISN